MKQCFDAVKNKMAEALKNKGFSMQEDKQNDYCVLFRSEDESLKLEYSLNNKQFYLYRGDSEADPDSFIKSQTYLFDHDNGDDIKEAFGVANEFIDTMESSTAKQKAAIAAARQRKKNKDSDENSAEFFVNRIPSILIECREPLLKHKAHYGQVLPRSFCEEVVKVAMLDMIKAGNKRKCASFFELLNSMYKMGDLDTRSIIVQVLLNSITGTVDRDYVESLLSDELKAAWAAGRKFIGKKVKPEKQSKLVSAGNLNDKR